MKQALRTLIKKGDTRALHLFGAGHKAEVKVDTFTVTPSSLSLGGAVQFTAKLTSNSSAPQKLVIDYAVITSRRPRHIEKSVQVEGTDTRTPCGR